MNIDQKNVSHKSYIWPALNSSVQAFDRLAVRTVIVEPGLCKIKETRTWVEDKTIMAGVPRPFTLIQSGVPMSLFDDYRQTTVGCIPEKITPVYCYKKDAMTSALNCRETRRTKMLPADWEMLARKDREECLYRMGLFPHLSSGHLNADGTFSSPKRKAGGCSGNTQLYNEAICTGYKKESIDVFVISSHDDFFPKGTEASCSWVTALRSAQLLEKKLGITPAKPFVFYDVAGGRISRLYTVETLLGNSTLDELESAIEEWNDFCIATGVPIEKLNELVFHYPPETVIQRVLNTKPPTNIDRNRLRLNRELVQFFHKKELTPEKFVGMVREGADPNLLLFPDLKHSSCKQTHIFYALIDDYMYHTDLKNKFSESELYQMVEVMLEYGLDLSKVVHKEQLAIFFRRLPRILKLLVVSGADLELPDCIPLTFCNLQSEEEVRNWLDVYQIMKAKNKVQNDSDLENFFLLRSYRRKAVDFCALFFRMAIEKNLYQNREAALAHIENYAEDLKEQEEALCQRIMAHNEEIDEDSMVYSLFVREHLDELRQLAENVTPEQPDFPSDMLPVLPTTKRENTIDSLQPLMQLFFRPELELSNPGDMEASVREILGNYYLTPYDHRQLESVLNASSVTKPLLRIWHGCDHVLRCTLIVEALICSFNIYHPEFRELLEQYPELEQLIMYATLMHDVTAEVDDKNDEEINAAREFEKLMNRAGYDSELVKKVGIALRNKNANTMDEVKPPFTADINQPEDVRLIQQLLRMPDLIDITRVVHIPPEFPAPPSESNNRRVFNSSMLDLEGMEANKSLIDEIYTYLVGAERLASLSGGQTPKDLRSATPFWQQLELLEPKENHHRRRDWLAQTQNPYAAIGSVLDDIVKLQLCQRAGCTPKSDLQLKQIELPRHLDTRQKLLIAGDDSHQLAELQWFVRRLAANHRRGEFNLLGTLTQDVLKSSKAGDVLARRGYMVDRVACRRHTVEAVYSFATGTHTLPPESLKKADTLKAYDYVYTARKINTTKSL